MKNAMRRAALVSMIAIVPAVSFAQSSSTHNGPVTRAQVLQDLMDLESVGYRPASANDATYPEDVQSAMRRLAEKRANEARLAREQVAQSGYGAPPAPNAEASAPAAVSGSEPPPGYRDTYRHH
ncbi:DUF4148 domain-containing protein [Paraburkholderia heleia]|uniref:DUF4148 domain-containing protein n=1 Tax=Paraburkholderia heleia TaxID=634127 RepID=UPI0031D8C0A2